MSETGCRTDGNCFAKSARFIPLGHSNIIQKDAIQLYVDIRKHLWLSLLQMLMNWDDISINHPGFTHDTIWWRLPISYIRNFGLVSRMCEARMKRIRIKNLKRPRIQMKKKWILMSTTRRIISKAILTRSQFPWVHLHSRCLGLKSIPGLPVAGLPSHNYKVVDIYLAISTHVPLVYDGGCCHE